MNSFDVYFTIQTSLEGVQENHIIFFTHSSFIRTHNCGRIRTAFLHLPALLGHLLFLDLDTEKDRACVVSP